MVSGNSQRSWRRILQINHLCRQNPRNDRVLIQRPTPGLPTLKIHRNIDIVGKLVSHDHRLGPIRIQARHALNARSIRVSITPRPIQNRSPRRNELAKLRHHVIVNSKAIRARRGINNHQPAAGRAPARAEVRAVRRVGAEGPSHGARGPVLQRAHGEVCGLRPAGLGRGPALGHVLQGVWVGGVEVGEDGPVERVGVAMPGYGWDVGGCFV